MAESGNANTPAGSTTATFTPQASRSLAQEGGASEIIAANTAAGTITNSSAAEKPSTLESKEDESPLQTLWKLVQGHEHNEIWAVTISDPQTHVPSQIVLQKYLNANAGDVNKAKEQLKSTLDYRAKNDVVNSVQNKYSKDKFAGLGYITSYPSDAKTPETREVFTWNIYGGVKDNHKSFGDIDAFIAWRVALMEKAMQELDLSNATTPITEKDDPYKIYQVHDYKSVSFLRSPPEVRAAAKKTIEVLAMAYPETLKEKFFINVPTIMGFMYGVMKLFVAPQTIRKFHPMSNGGLLYLEFGESKVQGLGDMMPKEYGGKGEALNVAGKELLLQ